MSEQSAEVGLFLQAVEHWGCDSYALDVRYLAGLDGEPDRLWEADIGLAPLPPSADYSVSLAHGAFSAGQFQRYPVRKEELLQLLDSAAKGVVELPGKRLSLPIERSLDFYTELSQRDRWSTQLHLQVSGARRPILPALQLAAIDTALRRGTPPFDGLRDLSAWFGMQEPSASGSASTIRVRVLPPVDLITERCRLSGDQLILVLHAHPKFDTSRVGLAVREVPGGGLVARTQVASNIRWKRASKGRREGIATISLNGADSALAMLTIGETTARRQWFLDSERARNWRLIATQSFDPELKMIRSGLFGSDSERFERGVAALLFLLGFSAAIQLETNSPDLIVATPGGRLVIVECTVRTSDFAAKVGKLVDRRGSLADALKASGHPLRVLSVLVCALPRDRISSQAGLAGAHEVVLLTREDLEAGLNRLRFPNDPDQLLVDAEAGLAGKSAARPPA